MTIRCISDQQTLAVADLENMKGDSVDASTLGAIFPSAAVVHVEEIEIAEWVSFGPRSGSYSENPKPSSVVVSGCYSVERDWWKPQARIDQIPDNQFGVGVLLEMPRILHRAHRHLDQVQIGSSTYSESELFRIS